MLQPFKSESDRGQSVVIGSVLMFGILIIALSMYQATGVPQQNQEVEFQHYTELRSDMITYSSTVDQTKSLETASTTITTSRPYPTRLVTVNPPPFTTRIEIGENNPTTITNFNVRSTGNEADYWSQQNEISIATSPVTAEPDYNVWQDSNPFVYENQVLYMQTDQLEPVVLDSTPPINDNTIELHGYTGELTQPTSSEKQIKVQQISSSRNVLYITGENNNTPIQLQLSTQIPEVTWRQILDVQNNDSIQSVDYDQNSSTLTIELDPSQTYILENHLSATNPSESTEAVSNPEYITSVSGEGVLSRQSIVLSVHDQLGNKTDGAVVTVSDDPNGCVSFNQKRTNDSGEVTFTCDTTQNTEVTFSINDGSESYETVTVRVRSTQSSGGGGGGGGPGN